MKFRKAGTDNGAHKAIVKSGTHVPEKKFSPASKIAKADKDGNKGSLATAKSLPTAPAKPNITPVAGESAGKWESSGKDWAQDYNDAKRRGKSVEDYEGSAHDRIADAAGDRKMAASESSEAPSSTYKRGTPAFSNRPKAAHGFGHSSGMRDGHLRNSGVPGAHRIGKK